LLLSIGIKEVEGEKKQGKEEIKERNDFSFFFWYWGLNPGPHHSPYTLPLKPLPLAVLLFVF
jgi:hypothetical protein